MHIFILTDTPYTVVTAVLAEVFTTYFLSFFFQIGNSFRSDFTTFLLIRSSFSLQYYNRISISVENYQPILKSNAFPSVALQKPVAATIALNIFYVDGYAYL